MGKGNRNHGAAEAVGRKKDRRRSRGSCQLLTQANEAEAQGQPCAWFDEFRVPGKTLGKITIANNNLALAA
jgi:hypothetical protein